MAWFGVVADPYSLPAWSTASKLTADFCMKFEPWSKQRALTTQLAEAKALGHDRIMITWEPWLPVAHGDPLSVYQSDYSLRSILEGRHNDYIDLFARALRDSGLGTVYLRFGHEMNGGWYPWSTDAAEYQAVWMYLRDRIRFSRKAYNVRFVWSPNPDLWATPARFLLRALPWWPPSRYVDDIGLTIIERGIDPPYTPELIKRRLQLIRDVFEKPIIACEVNCVRGQAQSWFSDLAAWVGAEGPFSALVLSQADSRMEAAGLSGDLSWSVEEYPEGRDAVSSLVSALHSQ